MEPTLTHATEFFATARERYNIKLRRDAGQPWPWTEDIHFRTWSFTNVHRENDKTTQWFRNNIRQPLSNFIIDAPISNNTRLKLVESTMIFRWFNRISTGEIIKDLLLCDEWDSIEAFKRLSILKGPVFTGAYIILGIPGQSKLEGVLEAIDNARPKLPPMVSMWYKLDDKIELRTAWNDLTTIGFLGPFMAYEIVMDLRYTPILEKAVDTMVWGNLGPGATRGMSWVVYGHPDGFNAGPGNQKIMLSLMAELLKMSKQEEYWPQVWPHWEMHEVEMWLCEHAKYMRASHGFRQKRRYTYNPSYHQT